MDGKDTDSGAGWLYAAWYVTVLLADLYPDQNLYPLRSCCAGGGWSGVRQSLVLMIRSPGQPGTRHQARTAKLNNASFEWKF